MQVLIRKDLHSLAVARVDTSDRVLTHPTATITLP